MIKRTILSKKM
jgi:tRNA-dihydrouridine synthase 1